MAGVKGAFCYKGSYGVVVFALRHRRVCSYAHSPRLSTSNVEHGIELCAAGLVRIVLPLVKAVEVDSGWVDIQES
jgi:hypothetical protein